MEKNHILIKNLIINYLSNKRDSNINLIFIHGWRSEAKIWESIMQELNISSYAIDLPGFGESQMPTNSYTLKDFSEIIKEFINKLNLENVILIGHSNGGAISIKTILNYPELILKLILVDSAGIREQTFFTLLKNLIAKIVKPLFTPMFMKPLREKLYTIMGSEDYIAEPKLKQTFINMISEDLSPRFKELNKPTLIIWGEKDKATPLSYAKFMNNEIRGSKLKIIPEAEHYSFLQNKQMFIDYIKEFINN